VRKACHCDGGIQFAFRDSCCRECFGRNSLGLDCDRLRNSRLTEHFSDSVVEICRGLAPLVVFVFRSDWARRVAAQAAELAYHLDEALGEIERNGEPAKDSRR